MHERNHVYLLFMLILSILALVALAAEVVLPLSAGTRSILEYADVIICGLFFLDFLLLLYHAETERNMSSHGAG